MAAGRQAMLPDPLIPPTADLDTAQAVAWLACLDDEGLPAWPALMALEEVTATTADALAVVRGMLTQ
jgi:hypothetical protein